MVKLIRIKTLKEFSIISLYTSFSKQIAAGKRRWTVTDKFNKKRIKPWTQITYRIEVVGHLNELRSDCLAGMHITVCKKLDRATVTTLVGLLKDQAELSGVLNSLYELHLPIVKVETVKDD